MEWLQQPKQQASSENQLVNPKGRRKGAAATASTTAPAERSTQQLSVTAVNGFLEAALQVAGAVNESGDSSRAVALAKEAVQAANELFNFPLAAAQLAAAGAQKKGGVTATAGGYSLIPNVTSYSLLIALHGAAGELLSVSDLVMAAVRRQLPLGGDHHHHHHQQHQQDDHEVWSPPAVEVLLSAAAGVWLAAGAADVAVSLLDGLLVTGGSLITQPTLAAAMLEAASAGGEEEQVSLEACIFWKAGSWCQLVPVCTLLSNHCMLYYSFFR
jgi:hypothetical protein